MGCKKMFVWGAPVLTTIGASAVHAAEGDVVANTVSMPGGVDIVSLIQSGVGSLGSVVIIAVSAWASWILVKMALNWVKKSLSGR